jgi:hypothetical protein
MLLAIIMRVALRRTSIAMRIPRPLIFGVPMLTIDGEAQEAQGHQQTRNETSK